MHIWVSLVKKIEDRFSRIEAYFKLCKRCWDCKYSTDLQIRVRTEKKNFFLIICCLYSKDPSQRDGSFEHTKHMLKLIGKEINANLGAQAILFWTYEV